MSESDVILWLQQPKVKEILISFLFPRTPGQVEKKLGMKKLKLKPFLEKHLIKTLNQNARKGRLYILTNKAKKFLQLSDSIKSRDVSWDIIGWIMASPRQRHVVLKAMDSVKRTSENIRIRASRYNSNLTRISTKQILKELIGKGLIDTEMKGRKRYYWLSEKGKDFVIAVEKLERKNI